MLAWLCKPDKLYNVGIVADDLADCREGAPQHAEILLLVFLVSAVAKGVVC